MSASHNSIMFKNNMELTYNNGYAVEDYDHYYINDESPNFRTDVKVYHYMTW